MGNDLIFKVAAGVFLGLGAWTYRSELGVFALYAISIVVVLYILMWCYQVVSTPIKELLKERKVNQLIKQLLNNNLINPNHEGALRLGLLKAYTPIDYTNIVTNFENYERDLRNGDDGVFFKNRINTLVSEVVEDFKQSTQSTASLK